MNHRIIFFKLDDFEREHISKSEALKQIGIEVGFEDGVLNIDNIPQNTDFDIAGVFVNSKIDKDVLDKLPNLKLIVALSTGYDHIDIGECKKRGIVVSYVPAYGENTVAEFTFALILALSRKVVDACEQVRETKSFDFAGLRGFDLMGKTLGLIGTGRIGKHVARIAKGFEMNIFAYDVIKDEKFAADMGFKYVSLEELLGASDIVTLHVPYMKQTHHLINTENIKLIKRGAYLINTSRGGVVETRALIDGLQSGNLAGAGLDVLEDEQFLKNTGMNEAGKANADVVSENMLLMDMPNVIVTPHNAFNTAEGVCRILDTTIENIAGFVNGSPKNLVPMA